MGISGFGNRGRWAVGVDDKRMCIRSAFLIEPVVRKTRGLI